MVRLLEAKVYKSYRLATSLAKSCCFTHLSHMYFTQTQTVKHTSLYTYHDHSCMFLFFLWSLVANQQCHYVSILCQTPWVALFLHYNLCMDYYEFLLMSLTAAPVSTNFIPVIPDGDS